VKKRNKIILSTVAVILVVLIIWIVWGNTALELNAYTVESESLPKGFDGFRIAQVSDLHNAQMGDDNKKLLARLREAEPDIIAITGDLIDSYHTDIAVALQFAESAMEIAPCYYVSGNHEARVSAYEELKRGMTELGVVILENERVELERNGQIIALLGVDDPSFQTDYLYGDDETVMKNNLQPLVEEGDAYVVLLSHRPELLDIYGQCGVDLVLSGHAHGGQFRLPFVGGLVAPNQGFFPEYDGGMYEKDGTTMLVSRGIGNSIFPFRFNNRPEVVVVELSST